MKKAVKAVVAMSVIAFASIAMANPKCSHRLASNTNDLLKNTNPVKVRVAKSASTPKSTSKAVSGVQ